MMTSRLDGILKAAGEPTRLRILNLLRHGPACVCELQEFLGVPQPTVSRHLSSLRAAGLVTPSRRGARVSYSLARASSPALRLLWSFLDQCCPSEPGLQKDLRRLASRSRRPADKGAIDQEQGDSR